MARRRSGTRKKRLATDSTRDTEWQREEYARTMGEEAAYRQELALRVERGLCTCPGFKPTTVKTRGIFRTIHRRECAKWKPWMAEYENVRSLYGYRHEE
jgi:hypothetical protein